MIEKVMLCDLTLLFNKFNLFTKKQNLSSLRLHNTRIYVT